MFREKSVGVDMAGARLSTIVIPMMVASALMSSRLDVHHGMLAAACLSSSKDSNLDVILPS